MTEYIADGLIDPEANTTADILSYTLDPEQKNDSTETDSEPKSELSAIEDDPSDLIFMAT